jgi:tripartite-type tricarboxylate transporter receptor subunit TctC
MRERRIPLQIFIMMMALFLIAPMAMAQEPYYAGKTIEFLITRGPGGGADTTGRHHAQLLSKFIPGNPRIRVVNNPGGALVFNDLYHRGKPEGLAVALNTGGDAFRWAIGDRGFDFKLDRMKLIAASGQTTVMYARTDVARSVPELVKRKTIRAGHSSGPGGTVAAVEEITSRVLALDIRRAYGYKSYGEVEMAVLRGELQLSGNNTLAYLKSTAPRVAAGEFASLFQMGFVSEGGKYRADPRLGNIPLFADVYRVTTGKNLDEHPLADYVASATSIANLGYTFWMHQGTPDHLVKIMVKAWTDMVNSDEFKALSKQKLGADDYILTGNDAVAVFKKFVAIPPELVDKMKKEK